MHQAETSWLWAGWEVPATVNAVSTTRSGGVSIAPWESFNLGLHVGDDADHVRQNRQRLYQALGLQRPALWLEQVHGTEVVDADVWRTRGRTEGPMDDTPVADAAVTRTPGQALAVMTADCLPLVFCHVHDGVVAVAHGGWRGLAHGIIRATVEAMGCDPRGISVWLGPAIGPQCFEVGDEVWDQFVSLNWQMARCFNATGRQSFLADIYAIARLQLQQAGISKISGGGYCTYTDAERFYSYRRDQQTGRMATLVWMTPSGQTR